jgi:hypothetical protein
MPNRRAVLRLRVPASAPVLLVARRICLAFFFRQPSVPPSRFPMLASSLLGGLGRFFALPVSFFFFFFQEKQCFFLLD